VNINLTLIGQAISFGIFVWFCLKFVWPPLLGVMAEREKKIADGLDAASRAERDLELAREKAAQQLRETKEQAAEIIDQANRRANQIVEEAKESAREEGERLKTAAHAEIEQEKNQAKEALRAEVAAIAVAGASKILGSSIDENAHTDLLNQLASEL